MEKVHLSIRIDLPNDNRFGPGKAALLRALLAEGSITAAAAKLEMSYPRALKLIDQMNASFKQPLVESKHGGAAGGGAVVTGTGQKVLDLYDKIAATSQKSCDSYLRSVRTLLKE